MGAQGVPFKNIDQIVMKRLQMKGFIVVDYLISNHPLVRKFWEDMTKWAEEGKVTMKEDIREGIESFPKAFQDILHGRNDGKLMIHIV